MVGLSEVDHKDVNKFGVIDGEDLGSGNYEIKKFVEKPAIEEAPSNLVAVGLYIITPEVMKILKGMNSGKSGESRLADAFDLMLEQGQKIYGKKIAGEWLDTGDKFGLIKATLKLGLKNGEVKDKLQNLINDLGQK